MACLPWTGAVGMPGIALYWSVLPNAAMPVEDIPENMKNLYYVPG